MQKCLSAFSISVLAFGLAACGSSQQRLTPSGLTPSVSYAGRAAMDNHGGIAGATPTLTSTACPATVNPADTHGGIAGAAPSDTHGGIAGSATRDARHIQEVRRT